MAPRGRRIWGRSAVAAAASVRGCGAGGGCGKAWTGGQAARTTWLDRGRWRDAFGLVARGTRRNKEVSRFLPRFSGVARNCEKTEGFFR